MPWCVPGGSQSVLGNMVVTTEPVEERAWVVFGNEQMCSHATIYPLVWRDGLCGEDVCVRIGLYSCPPWLRGQMGWRGLIARMVCYGVL